MGNLLFPFLGLATFALGWWCRGVAAGIFLGDVARQLRTIERRCRAELAELDRGANVGTGVSWDRELLEDTTRLDQYRVVSRELLEAELGAQTIEGMAKGVRIFPFADVREFASKAKRRALGPGKGVRRG